MMKESLFGMIRTAAQSGVAAAVNSVILVASLAVLALMNVPPRWIALIAIIWLAVIGIQIILAAARFWRERQLDWRARHNAASDEKPKRDRIVLGDDGEFIGDEGEWYATEARRQPAKHS